LYIPVAIEKRMSGTDGQLTVFLVFAVFFGVQVRKRARSSRWVGHRLQGERKNMAIFLPGMQVQTDFI